MPRPKSDLKAITIKLGEADRALLAGLADAGRTTLNEVVRVAIREMARKRLKAGKGRGTPPG